MHTVTGRPEVLDPGPIEGHPTAQQEKRGKEQGIPKNKDRGHQDPLHLAVLSVPAQAEGISVGCWAMLSEQTYAQRNSPQLPKTFAHVQFTSPIGQTVCLS